MSRCVFIDSKLDVALHQMPKSGRFVVRYGKQVSKDLSYDEAYKRLGSCIMHALACAGELESEELMPSLDDRSQGGSF